MSEQITRHRSAGRDENGQLTPATDETLTARAVAPGGGAEFADRARDGETIDAVVYFARGTDLVNSDELTVRGQRYHIVVNDWRSPWTAFGGLEVLCSKGQG